MNSGAMRWQDSDETAIEAQAREWARLLASDSKVDHEAFKAWRDSDVRHDDAFWSAWRAWQGAGHIRLDDSWRDELAQLTHDEDAMASRRNRSKMIGFALPAALAACIAAFLLMPAMRGAPPVEVRTPVGHNQIIALGDGTRVTAGAKTDFRAYIDKDRRRVELAEGQAFFEVAHDPSRPFVVVAGDAEIRVTGTKFDVKMTGDGVTVSVLEGRVEVKRRGLLSVLTAGKPEQILTAGQVSELEPGQAFTKGSAANGTPGEWRTGRLFYTDAPLADILSDAERYSGQRYRAANADIAAMRLTASFRVGHVDGLIENIEAATPLVARKQPDGSIVFALRGS